MASERVVIHLATGNAHKAREMQRLADESGLAVRIEPAGRMPEVEEDAGTFVGNARKKARALAAQGRFSWRLLGPSLPLLKTYLLAWSLGEALGSVGFRPLGHREDPLA